MAGIGYMLVCVVVVKLVQGVSLRLNGVSNAVLDQTYTLHCTVSPLTDISSYVRFSRMTGQSGTWSRCLVNSECVERFPAPGYSCGCYSNSGGSQVFNLTIQSAHLTDEANWRCEHITDFSNSFSLTVFSPVTSVDVEVSGSTPSSVTVVEGTQTVFTCFIQGAKPAPTSSLVSWYRQDTLGNKLTLPGSVGNPYTSQRNTSVTLTYNPNKTDNGKKVFCAARNSLMVEQGDSEVTSSNKIELLVEWSPVKPSISGQESECPASYISSATSGSCVCSTTDRGNPAGSISWIDPDGVNTGSSQLVLNMIPRRHNNRTYICRVLNKHGSQQQTFTPKLAFGPESVSVSGNQQHFDADGRNTLTLQCTSSSSSPSVTFTWRNLTNQQVITSNQPIMEQNAGDGGKHYSQKLMLTPLWFQDGDGIRCEARNTIISGQTVSEYIVLNLTYPPLSPPEIKGYQTGTPVYETDTLSISCEVKGGKPVVSSVNLSCYGGHHSTSSRVEGGTVIADISFQLSRNINLRTCQCSATHQTNRYTDTDQVTVTVYYPPSVPTLQPGPQGFPWLEGHQNKYLRCSVSDRGNPPCTYVWFRDDVKDSSQTSSTWTFSSLSYTDNGSRFYCQAQNRYTLHKHHPKSSSVQTLTVYYHPKITITPSGPITEREGQSLSPIGCTADSNPANPRFSWTSDSDIPWTGGLPLQISQLDRGHHGRYTCKASVSSSLGTLTGTATISITVNYAPDIKVESLSTKEGEPLTVTCEATGRPATYTFSKFKQTWNGQIVGELGGGTQGNTYVRSISSASYQDSGVYTCSVQNGIPDRNNTLDQVSTTKVLVKATPKITKETEFETIIGEVGKPTVLQKTVFCKPNYTRISWSKSENNTTFNYSDIQQEDITLQIHDKIINDSGYRISLNITTFNQEDIGTYKLKVCNQVGCSEFSVNLTAAGPPLAPTELREEAESTTDTILLSWLPNYPGGNFKQRFLLEYKLQSESEWKTDKWYDDPPKGQKVFANITNLVAKQVYDVRVSAVNDRPRDNVSKYVQIEVMTKAQEDAGKSSSVIGAAVGGAVGSATLIVVIVMFVFLRRSASSCLSRKHNDTQSKHRRTVVTVGNANRQHRADMQQQGRTSDNIYEGLQIQDPVEYSKLHIYENTGADTETQIDSPDHTYEGLQERRDSAQYSKLNLYEN